MSHQKREDYKRALRLEYFTVGFSLLEAASSLIFGTMALSIALIGFGLDSVVEALSGMILIWRLYDHATTTKEQKEKKEALAVRFVGISFLLLGAYVLYESLKKLILSEAPETSMPGIVVAAVSLVVMLVLGRKKRILGEQMQSRALIADSRETIACAWLSAALLLGLGANALFGFWQADPLAGLAIVYFLFKEGWENISEQFLS